MPAKDTCGAGKTNSRKVLNPYTFRRRVNKKDITQCVRLNSGVAAYGRTQESGFYQVGCVFRILIVNTWIKAPPDPMDLIPRRLLFINLTPVENGHCCGLANIFFPSTRQIEDKKEGYCGVIYSVCMTEHLILTE